MKNDESENNNIYNHQREPFNLIKLGLKDSLVGISKNLYIIFAITTKTYYPEKPTDQPGQTTLHGDGDFSRTLLAIHPVVQGRSAGHTSVFGPFFSRSIGPNEHKEIYLARSSGESISLASNMNASSRPLVGLPGSSLATCYHWTFLLCLD